MTRRATFWAAALIILSAWVAYAGSLTAPFVFDDGDSIVNNPSIHHLWPLGPVLSPPYDQGQTVGGRPLLNLSLALNYAVGGTSVKGYHAVNLGIHMLAGLLVLGVVRRTLRRIGIPHETWIAFAVALLWTVHPLQTESVTYVVQRAESLMGMFYLLTLYCFIRYSATRKGWAILAFISCLLGMATKEVMVSAPLIVFLYDATFVAGSWREAWRQRCRFHLALASTWILLALLVLNSRSRGGTSGFHVGVAWPAYYLTQPGAVGRYLQLTFWPSPLVFDYGPERVTRSWPAMLGGLALLGVLGWSMVGLAKSRPLSFCTFWFFAILAPTSLIPGNRQTLAEHRMYLALLPVIAIIVVGATAWLARRGRAALRGGAGALGVAGIALICLTGQRNRVYANELGLWQDTVNKVPKNAYAHNNLGVAWSAIGRQAEAAAEYRTALQIKPDYAQAENNLGNVVLRAGRSEEALALFHEALQHQPRYPEALSNLGVALTGAGRNREAIEAFERALVLAPNYAKAQFNLGVALAADGQETQAKRAYSAALDLDPHLVEARLNLGNLLAHEGQVPEAIQAYREVLQRQPAYFEAHFNLAGALVLAGSYREAAAEYETALGIRPDDEAARRNLGRVRSLIADGEGAR